MTLAAGDRLGHYDVTALIGEGGMGQVYRATDRQLGRQVALKILTAEFAADRDRVDRFQREAQVLASLSHPGIAAIHGLERTGATPALVLELVEGPTLADRLRRGPLDLDEALGIATQIAEALEAAHGAGVVHRDLKPANIKVRDDGTVKVLDFGLAKAVARSPEMSSGLSPTMTDGATQVGVVLGTAAYMSPEQARGKAVDKRTDIWAFGAVLFEMLTGRRPFPGDDVSQTIARVIEREPDWQALPATVPAALEACLRRCLQKDPRQRTRDIGDVRLALDDVLAAAPNPSRRGPAPWRPVFGVALAAAALLGAAVTWWSTHPAPTPSNPPLRVEARFGGLSATEGAVDAVVSPDGTHLAYTTMGENASFRVSVRPLDRLDGTPVAGYGVRPFFSPDGAWLAFFTANELRKMPADGSASQVVASVQGGLGGSWGDDGTIIVGSISGGLSRVSANGGEPEALTRLTPEEVSHGWPQRLPGGRAVLFTSTTRLPGQLVSGATSLNVLNLDTRERIVVQAGSRFGRFVPPASLVYVAGSTLFAVPFDVAELAVRGPAVPLASGLYDTQGLFASFSVSHTGMLAYLAANTDDTAYPVVWVDRDGTTTSLWNVAGQYAHPMLSPDGTRLALLAHSGDNVDVWVYDMDRGVPTRLTVDESRDDDHVWSPDGRSLAFQSDRAYPPSVYRISAAGSMTIERLTAGEYPTHPESWSTDGAFLTYVQEHPDTLSDIWVLPLANPRAAEVFANTAVAERNSVFSPNGRWIAYATLQVGGRREVFVRAYPPTPDRWQVSTNGGTQPRWSGDGRELYYRTDAGIMVVTVDPDAETFSYGRPEVLFEGAFQGGLLNMTLDGERYRDYDVTSDGKRFVMFPRSSRRRGADHVTLIVNVDRALRSLEAPR